jgi:anti-sigma B factor antagonist
MTLQSLIRTLGDVKVVDCRGRIVLGDETAELRQLVRDLLRPSAHIVLNLTQVNHIDSNGIGMLVGLHVAAKNVDAVIKLAGLVDHVKNVMETTRLITLFESYPTVEEAVASFGATTQVAKAS